MMKKMKNYLVKIMGLIMLGFIVYAGYIVFDELLIEELEDFIHDLSPIVVDDGTYFDVDDTLLGITMITSFGYTAIKLIEGIFRKEDKHGSNWALCFFLQNIFYNRTISSKILINERKWFYEQEN